MAEIKWIKLNVDMFDDEKIKIIQSMPDGDALLVIWIKLITLAGKTNDNGYIYIADNIPYTEEMLSVIMNKPLLTIRLAIETFTNLQMIDADTKGIYLVNFEKHQSLDKMAQIKEQNRLRKQRERERKKLMSRNVTQDVTQCHAIDKDIEEDLDKEKEFLFSLSRARVWEKYFIETSMIKMSNAEFDEICDNLSIEDVDRYLGIIENCEENGKPYTKKTHFQAVMDMATNDSKVVKRKKGSSKKLECGGAYDLAAFEKALDEK